MDDLKCPVCRELYTDPRILPQCEHSICMACMPYIMSAPSMDPTRPPKLNLVCPICFCENPIGPGTFKANRQLSEVIKTLEAEAKPEQAEMEPGEAERSNCVKRAKTLQNRLLNPDFSREQFAEFVDTQRRQSQQAVEAACRKLVDTLLAVVTDKQNGLNRLVDEFWDREMRRFDQNEIRRMKAKVELGGIIHEMQEKSTSDMAPGELSRYLERVARLQSKPHLTQNRLTAKEMVIDDDALLPLPLLRQLVSVPLESAVTWHEKKVDDLEASSALALPSGSKLVPPVIDAGPMFLAIARDDVAYFEQLQTMLKSPSEFEKVTNVREPQAGKLVPLQKAVLAGSFRVVKCLIEQLSADVGVVTPDSHGLTLMHLAIRGRHADIARYLVSIQPELAFRQSKIGSTPLHEAAFQGNLEIVQFLTKDVKVVVGEMCRHKRRNALHFAAMGNHPEIVTYLVRECGLESGQVDAHGQTPLHVASAHGSFGAVKTLLGINPQLQFMLDASSETALSLAEKRPNECADVIAFLEALSRMQSPLL